MHVLDLIFHYEIGYRKWKNKWEKIVEVELFPTHPKNP